MATLLLELFSEEIPSRMQRGAAEQLQRLMLAGFEKNMLKPSGVKTFVSPRHLAIQCFGLPLVQPDTREEKRGPKIGAPEQAMKGFLQSTGLTLEACEQRDGYYYATLERKGRAVAEVVKEICESALTAFGWPKSMRWGARSLSWVRPLHRIACLLDDAVVPVQFAHLTASNLTEGHRFMAPAPLTIAHAEQYETLLRDANVLVDYAERRARIAAEIAALAAAANLIVAEDGALLDEVTGLVEWPVPLLCRFDEKFLALPPEVLVSEMKNHQRYFALKTADGALSNQFITVANMVTADGGAKVKEGNARVVRARLADGEFYWEQDRKTSLEDWGKKLSDVVFHAKVGMMDAKVARIEALAVKIIELSTSDNELPSREIVRTTANLCKADLTSGMVGEFPELEGIMGRYYALHEQMPTTVADAIRDHHKPKGANDSLPETALGSIIAIADKLDTITSLFVVGEKPTGSKDPLALRRAALGILRIITDKRLLGNLNLSDLTAYALSLCKIGEPEAKLLHSEIMSFFEDRLRVMLKDKGYRTDIIDAVLSVYRADMPWLSFLATHFLNQDAQHERMKALIAALKRVSNLLAAEEKKAKKTYDGLRATLPLLNEPAELALAQSVLPRSDVGFGISHDPLQTLEHLKTTAPLIEKFFDEVLVNSEDKNLKEERLSLLASVRSASQQIADFSKLEG